MNMLGVCVSKKTFECFEAKVSSQVQEELLNFLDEDDAPFSMVSLDKFNERQKYKAVWHGDGSRGFNGATSMIIQPGPKSIKIPADQRTNLIKHTNTDLSLACIDTKLELHLALFLSGNSDLSLSYVNGVQGQQTFGTEAMEEINRLFIYYIDRLKPHIKHLSLSVLDDPS